MTDAESGKQRVDCRNLNTTSAAVVAQVGRCHMILAVGNQERERSESVQNCLAIFRTRQALQQLLQYEPCRQDRFAGFEGVVECAYLCRSGRRIAPKCQGPNAGVDKQAQSRPRSALSSYPASHSSLPIKSSRRFCCRRAMNSCNAFVTAAFFVRSPLTLRARSISAGSIERFVAMCNSPHINLHTENPSCNGARVDLSNVPPALELGR